MALYPCVKLHSEEAQEAVFGEFLLDRNCNTILAQAGLLTC